MGTIAWIEDDSERIGALVKLLKDDGHTILTYGSKQEVEKEINQILKCDAIILDVILPPITDDNPYTGLSILQLLRREYEYKGPIVVCSRVQNQEVRRLMDELKITQFLHKPTRPSILHNVVTEAMDTN